MSNNQDKIIITSFSDPVCTWCWGTEPIFRKLETHFPEKIEFHYLMGGLVEDAHKMQDPSNGIGSTDINAFNQQVVSHWVEASNRHGMPVDADHFNLFSEEYPSTYPQNIAYKAAQLSNPELADQYLYNLRVAAAAEARLISHEDVQVSIASETGLDIGTFLTHLHDGSAEQEFNKDQEIMSALHVSAFPTFIVSYHDSQYMLRGYNSYDNFVAVINAATKGSILPIEVEATEDNLLSFMDNHPRMASEEIRLAFDLNSQDEVQAFIYPLIEAEKLEIQNAGNGWFAKKISQNNACDLRTGLCS